MNRRTLLYALGSASFAPLSALPETAARRAVIVGAGENRFPYASAAQAKRSPCKLTSDDTAGALSIFELNVAPRSGPVRHVHHREDEWCYVLAGEFIFEVGSEKHTLPVGASTWMPRDIPHVWANQSTEAGKLLVTCQPGGFEHFFDALGKIPEAFNEAQIKQVMAEYGMEYLGPPLFGLWREKHP